MNTLYLQAGLTYSDEKVTQEYVKDWRKMSEYFEKATPVWTPGTASGYHALTIGFLFDQIVRRVDPQKRGLVQILNEDYIDKYGEPLLGYYFRTLHC